MGSSTEPPRRIVSLVPSLTELVCWLGLSRSVVGRTTFCTEPAADVAAIERIGGTKNPKVARIIALAPDLVLANKEENRREDVEALRAAGLDVLLTDPNSVEEAATMIEDLGRRLGRAWQAAALARDTRAELRRAPPDGPRVFVAVWKEPLLGLGSATYGDSVLAAAGGRNVLASRERYPALAPGELEALAPDFIVLPDEPYPFTDADAAAFARVAPARVVDGKLLWWYGPRIPASVAALRSLLQDFAAG